LNGTRTYYRNGTAGPVTLAPALRMTLNSLKRMGSVIVVRFAKLVCALQIGCCGSKLLSQGHLASNAQTQPHLHGRAVFVLIFRSGVTGIVCHGFFVIKGCLLVHGGDSVEMV